MPSKKKTSCEIVRQGIAGPAPDQILDAIRAEYWLPQPAPPKPDQDADEPKSKPQVKP